MFELFLRQTNNYKKRSASFLCLTISLSLSVWLRPQFNCLLFLSTITTFDKMFPRVCVCMYVLDVCLQKKNWDRIRPFQTKRIFLDCLLFFFFFLFYPFLLLFLVARFEFATSARQREWFKKVSSESFQTKLEDLPNFDFQSLPPPNVNLWRHSGQAFFFCFLLFLTFCSILILFCWVFVFFFFTCCKLRSLSYTPSLLLLLLPSPLPASCFV